MKRNNSITVTLSEGEYKIICQRAIDSGLSLASYLRQRGLQRKNDD
jgi:hypothetical protein